MTGDPGDAAPAPLRRLALPLGIVVALVLSGLIVAGLIDDSSHVRTLLPGDCLRAPEETQVIQVDRVDCADPHEFEVFAVVEMAGSVYPGDQRTFERGMEACEPHLEAYVGSPPDPTHGWLVNVLTPARDGWEAGDRSATCVAYRLDEDQFFATVEGSARIPGDDGRAAPGGNRDDAGCSGWVVTTSGTGRDTIRQSAPWGIGSR